jgi:hypothetical protein
MVKNMIISNEEFNKLREKGKVVDIVQTNINQTNPQINTQEKDVGFLQGMAQGIVSPFAKAAATGASVVGNVGKGFDALTSLLATKGMTAEQRNAFLTEEAKRIGQATPTNLNLGYFGEYQPMEKTGEAIGAGAEIALTAIPFMRGGMSLIAPAKAGLKTLAGRSAIYGGLLGASTAAEQGENIVGVVKQGVFGGTLGAMLPIGGKIISKTIKAMPEIFNITTGGQKEAFTFQLKNPAKAGKAMKKALTFEEISQKGIEASEILKDKASMEYQKGLEILREVYPKPTMEKPLQTQINKIFRSSGDPFNINITKNGVQFSKGGRLSNIVSKAEKDHIISIYDDMAKQKDWSVKGAGDFLEWLNSKRTFETQTNPSVESAFVSSLIEKIKRPIYQAYPELEGVANNYSQNMNLYNQAAKFFNARKQGDANAMVASIKKSSRIFDENSEPFYRLAEQVEKETGVSLLAELSSAELQKVFPNLIRTVAGIGGAAASLKNPLVLFLLPFMTQRSASWMTRGGGRVLQAAPTIQQYGTAPANLILNQIRQRIIGNK